jgi:hypothetical protein
MLLVDESSVMKGFRGAKLLDHRRIPLYASLPTVNERPRPIPARRCEEGGLVEAKTPERGVARSKFVRHIVCRHPHPRMSERTV